MRDESGDNEDDDGEEGEDGPDVESEHDLLDHSVHVVEQARRKDRFAESDTSHGEEDDTCARAQSALSARRRKKDVLQGEWSKSALRRIPVP